MDNMEEGKQENVNGKVEIRKPGEGPINKTKSIRRELTSILQDHNDGQLMDDVLNKTSGTNTVGKLVKTKTASGLSLPAMVFTENKTKELVHSLK